ncbi:MAG: hypothetical protein IPH75_16170 [bacterium]|nr:hypothetical protein [bacterium]
MTQDKRRPNAEEKLNNLTKILCETNPEEVRELTDEEQRFIQKAMTLVYDWRHGYLMDEGRRRQSIFESFAEPIRKGIVAARNSGGRFDIKTSGLQLAASGTWFRKLEQISQSDIEGAALDDELLKLFDELDEPPAIDK